MDYLNRMGVTTDDQSLADAVGRFALAELAPTASELDEAGASVTCHLKALSELGVMGMNLPERWGGPGVSPTGLVLSLVEISRACAATSSMVGAHFLGTDAVLIGGDDAQRETWLPRAASGEWLAGFALTEPRGGSSPADLRTLSVRDGDVYRIDSVKHFTPTRPKPNFWWFSPRPTWMPAPAV